MHWNKTKQVPVLYFSRGGLGQSDITPTELTPKPVALGASKLPALISWGVLFTIIGVTIMRSGKPSRFSAGPDAPTLLAREARRIQRRVQRRQLAKRR